MRKLFSHAVRAGLLCLGVSASAVAQCNLVPNGNFDTQLVTPPNGGDGNVLTGYPYVPGGNGGSEVAYWRATNYSTPDYRATNAQAQGSQPAPPPYPGAPSPNGYMGIYAFSNGSYGQQRYQEYITLVPEQVITLEPTEYYATMQVCRSTASTDATNMGMVLSTDDRRNDLRTTNAQSSGYTPTLYNLDAPQPNDIPVQSSGRIYATDRWTPIARLITPTTTRPTRYYINIGNFQQYKPDDNQPHEWLAYYFVEDVGIYKVPTAGPPVTICPGSSTVIGSGCDIPGATYRWSLVSGPGPLPYAYGGYRSQLTVSPSNNSTYQLTVNFPNGESRTSTVTVTVQAATPKLKPLAVDDCTKTAPFHLDEYSSAYRYAISNISTGLVLPAQYNPNALPADFSLKGSSDASTGGSFTLTLTGCGTTSVPGNVSFNTPSPGGYYYCGYAPSNGSSVKLSSVQTLDITNAEGGDVGMFLTNTSYNYSFTSSNSAVSLTTTQGTNTHFILKPGQGTTITASATNAPCVEVGRFVFNTTSRRPAQATRVTPNPANSELTISTGESPEAAGPLGQPAPLTVELYDRFGRRVKTQRSATSQTVLDVRDVPSGLYYLRSGTGKAATSTPVQIAH